MLDGWRLNAIFLCIISVIVGIDDQHRSNKVPRHDGIKTEHQFNSSIMIVEWHTISQHLLNHLTYDASELVKKHPPQFHNQNKQVVYNLICPKGSESHHGRLEYTRWRQLELPTTIDVDKEHQSTLVEGFFTYDSPPTDRRESHWHVNFADPLVFGFYGGSLFAQDEMQCLEHPVLCSLRELLHHLSKSRDPLLNPGRTTGVSGNVSIATPILVSGVERRAHIRTDSNVKEGRPRGLYGNNFAIATSDTIRRATTSLDVRLDAAGNPYFTNIIAMAAPTGGGRYTENTIRRILVTAYTAFVAASMESMVQAGFLIRHHDGDDLDRGHTTLADPMPSGEAPVVKIHTGNWGCGAFGGNPVIVAMLQTLAAQMAGVEVVDYVQGTANKQEYENGMKDLRELLDSSAQDGKVTLDTFIKAAVKKQYRWGVSNGT